MNENIERLRELLDLPITTVKVVRKGNSDATWHFTLEGGATARVTATQLCNQRRFQARMVEAGVVPMEVRPAWWRDVIKAVLGAAKEDG